MSVWRDEPTPAAKGRVVHVRKGQRVLVDAGRGAQVTIERFPSGAVELRNAATGAMLRQWSPQEARRP